MLFNETSAISTPKVLLVPYDRHHVPQYHKWMEDAAIREATASDHLTLEEEYENQQSWRTSADKITFIVCLPLSEQPAPGPSKGVVVAGRDDATDRMVGDVNLFLTPWEDPSEDEDDVFDSSEEEEERNEQNFCVGEVDIMIADPAHRGQGLGKAAVRTFLAYVTKNLRSLLAEYKSNWGIDGRMEMKELLVRIKESNEGSIALFNGLGFEQRGEVNYFGEIEMVRAFVGASYLFDVEGYSEMIYERTGINA